MPRLCVSESPEGDYSDLPTEINERESGRTCQVPWVSAGQVRGLEFFLTAVRNHWREMIQPALSSLMLSRRQAGRPLQNRLDWTRLVARGGREADRFRTYLSVRGNRDFWWTGHGV